MHKPEWLSKGAEFLLKEWEGGRTEPYDVVIVGSGYGGAVAAARLAASQEKGRDLEVCVLERGREHLPRTFPSRFSDLPGHVRFSRFDDPTPKGVRDGLFDLRIGEDVTVLLANGLGGGSLFNAGVVEKPEWDVFDDEWPKDIREDWGRKDSPRRDCYYDRVRTKLGATSAAVDGLDKHSQFDKLIRGLGLGLEAERAKIAVDHDRCAKCGDCATGCNFGARKTLATESNYLAEARQHGAKLYTGASISHLEKRDGGEWAVFLGLTVEPRPLKKSALCEIRAKTVILAAGALGSTEILMRSAALSRDLRLSKCLGSRFSTNGDMIAALYGQRCRVNAAPAESTQLRERNVGPTITGIARTGTTQADRVAIEELAIPGALRRVFEEVVTTAAMLERLGQADEHDHRPLSAHDPELDGGAGIDALAKDPAAVDPEAIERCQVFAMMGDDGAGGKLEMVPGWNEPSHLERVNDGAIRVHWPNAGGQPIYEVQDKLFGAKKAEGQDKLLRAMKELGGTYLRSPLWRPLPDDLARKLSGPKPSGLLFSMHPLGGCRMADDVEHGVVDHMGRVFDAATERDVHPRLLVLDGSIVPTALGINPLLTITALAERAIELYCDKRSWRRKPESQRLPDLPDKPEIERRKAPRNEAAKEGQEKATTISPEAVTGVRFAERLTGELTFAPGATAMESELSLEFEPIDNLLQFLSTPLHPMKLKKGALRVRNPADESGPQSWQEAEVLGSVELLVRGASTARERIWGALSSYGDTRFAADLASKVQGWRKPVLAPLRLAVGLVVGLARAIGWSARGREFLIKISPLIGIKPFVTLASHVGEIRYLFYQFTLQSALLAGNALLPEGTVIKGRKTLKYCAHGNPWRQLTDLSLTAYPFNGAPIALGTLTVDPAYFFRGFASQLQITKQRDLPAAWMDLASLALFLARIILKIHFWSFRLPEYQKYDPKRDEKRWPGEISGLRMERHIVGYPETPRDAGIFLPITRYRMNKGKCPNGPVVLFHGLGSGGIQFATSRVKPNLAEYLAKHGFDVWVAELRTSIALPYSLDQWTIDEVARQDIPRIIDRVLEKTGEPNTGVVAHCIGSAMFCTAVLDGRLQHPSGESKVRRAVLLQVGPLVTLSKGTRLRGLVTAPLRRFFPQGHVDFSVDDRAGWAEALIDRLVSTYPYPAEEARHHRLGWSWKHNSHIANCNRWAALDGRMIEHDNLSAGMLDALGEVLGHSSITTWTQTIEYAFVERLTNSDGRNAYVTAENIRDRFTFPVRFLHGGKSDVFHPLTSLRSQKLIQNVHGKRAAQVKILRNYSHFDPLIGKNAKRDVFRRIPGFLRKKNDRQAQQQQEGQAKHYYVRRPLVGPVLGWLRRDAATGASFARIWCRIDDLRSPATCALVHVLQGGKSLDAKVLGGESLDVGPVDTLLCVDMAVGDQHGKNAAPCEIVVLSVHESFEPEDKEGQRKSLQRLRTVERAAGKRESAAEPHLTVGSSGPTLEERLKDPAIVARLRERVRADTDDLGYDKKIDCATVKISEVDEARLTLALASCRYPGWLVDRERADAVFGHLRSQMEAKEKVPAALLLVGDQIYADATAGAFDPKDRRERFYDAYREAWTAPNARDVLSRLPVYMMMDDHEAGDNWHRQDFLDAEEREMRGHGIDAVMRYQWMHSPGNPFDGKPPACFYYDFKIGTFPVFVCDTRSGRSGRERILDRQQFENLKQWLRASQREVGGRPKFVVSPSVVVPFLKTTAQPAYAARSDGWDGFPAQLAELFAFVFLERVENVVFLCGDAHLSMRSDIWFEDEKGQTGPKAFCIVGSPMYAPYPFANAKLEEYQTDGRPLALPGAAAVMWHRVIETAARDNFALVTVEREGRSWTVESRFLPEEPKAPEAQHDIAADAALHPGDSQREREARWTIRSET